MAAPYRADHVGSLLRPPELLQARTDFSEGRITAEHLREVEDAAVLKALELQREAGISVFTEGEYRRAGWSAAVRESVEGLVPDPDPPIRRLLGTWQDFTATWRTPASSPSNLVAGARLRQVRRLPVPKPRSPAARDEAVEDHDARPDVGGGTFQARRHRPLHPAATRPRSPA
jgi:hypothetical protein